MFDIFLAWLMFWFIIAPVMFMVGIGALIEDPFSDLTLQVLVFNGTYIAGNLILYFGCRWLIRRYKHWKANRSGD